MSHLVKGFLQVTAIWKYYDPGLNSIPSPTKALFLLFFEAKSIRVNEKYIKAYILVKTMVVR